MNRRNFVATTAGLGSVLVAGCSGNGGGGGSGGGGSDGDDGGGGGGSGGSGTFQLLISDQPAAIEDFESLEVTLSSARVFRADEDEEITPAVVNETSESTETPESTDTTESTETTDEEDADGEDEESEGFVEFDLGGTTVDLTEVIGDRAVSVLESELEEGRYSGIELRVSEATGVVDGETVDVMVPSNRLRIIKPFEIAPDEELSFVFDINVIRKGPRGGYNLLPVIGKSGVAGEDVDVEEVDDEDHEDGDDEETETAEPTATATDGGTADDAEN